MNCYHSRFDNKTVGVYCTFNAEFHEEDFKCNDYISRAAKHREEERGINKRKKV